MASRLQVIQSIENYSELSKPGDGELRIFDVRVVRDNFDVGVELLRRIFGHLHIPLAHPQKTGKYMKIS